MRITEDKQNEILKQAGFWYKKHANATYKEKDAYVDGIYDMLDVLGAFDFRIDIEDKLLDILHFGA
jgi:hypothetical protein